MPFGAVLGALLIGLVVTMIIQSSSASTGIVIALGAGGLINLYTALPLVLGANIGTTVTAQLAAIPANRVAKQAALAHTLFNVIGTVIMLVFFYVPWGSSGIPVFFHIVDAVTPGGCVRSSRSECAASHCERAYAVQRLHGDSAAAVRRAR